MLTKAEWDAMTPQAQWDMAQSLMADVEAYEAEIVEPLLIEATNGVTLERLRSMPQEEFDTLFPLLDDEDMTYS